MRSTTLLTTTAAILALPAVLAATPAPAAPAASDRFRPGTVSTSGTAFTYVADSATDAPRNSAGSSFGARVYRTPDGGFEFVVDPDGVRATTGCRPADQVYICNTRPGDPVIDIAGNGRGPDDVRLYVRPVPPDPFFSVPATIRTGGGGDTVLTTGITGTVGAGRGRDLIGVEAGFDETGPVPTPGGDVRGGRGVDTVTYAGGAGLRIRVSLDDRPDDGRTGEGDNIHADVENLVGPSTGFTAIGSSRPNVLTGGREGADRLVGRGGRDTLLGQGGDDRLDARDGRGGDVVKCGSGNDRVRLDRGDSMIDPGRCERVTYR